MIPLIWSESTFYAVLFYYRDFQDLCTISLGNQGKSVSLSCIAGVPPFQGQVFAAIRRWSSNVGSIALDGL